MPIVTDQSTGALPDTQEPSHVIPNESLLESAGRNVATSSTPFDFMNAVGNITAYSGLNHTPDPNFDPHTEMAKYPPGAYDVYPQLNDAKNSDEFNFMKSQIDKDNADKQTAVDAGAQGSYMGLVTGLFDPINAVGIGEAKNLYQLKTAFMPSVIEGAKVGAGFGLGVGALNYAAHPTATINDMGDSIADTALLGTALGGSVGLFRDALAAGKIISGDKLFTSMKDVASDIREKSRQYADTISQKFEGYVPQESAAQAQMDAGKPVEGSVGAAAAPKTTLEQESLRPGYVIPEKLAEALPEPYRDAADLSKLLARTHMDATVELMNSPNIETRRTVQSLADVTADVQKNREGIASDIPVEAYMKQREGEYTRATMDTYNAFMQYRAGRNAKVGDAMTGLSDYFRGAPAGKLNYPEFQQAIGEAMWQGDKHPIPEVAQAASQIWRPLFDKLKDDAIKHNLLPVDVKPETAATYLTRVYNREKIIARRPELASILTGWFKENQGNASAKYAFHSGQAKMADDILAKQYARRDELRKSISDAQLATNPEAKAQLEVLRKEMKAKLAEANEANKKMNEAKAAGGQTSRTITGAKYPVQNFIKKKGGVRIGSNLDGELRAMGVNPETAPGLFKKSGGLGDVDNFPHSEWNLSNAPKDETGHYVDRQYILDSIRDERVGNPITKGQKEFDVDENAHQQHQAAQAELDRIKGEAQERVKKFDDMAVAHETANKQINAAKAELDDVKKIIEANESKAKSFRDHAEDAMYLAGADDDELRMLSNEIIDGLVGLEPGRLSYEGVPVKRGPLKERTLTIPDERINEFLDRNIFHVGKKYVHTMASDVGLTNKFGTADMRHAMQKISDGYDSLRLAAATKHGYNSFDFEGRQDVPPELQKELKLLDKSQRRDQELITGIRDRLRGRYGAGANPYSMGMRTYRVIKGINYLRSLGMMPITALSHVAKIPAVHGIERVMGDGVGAMMRNMSQFKLSASEAKLANAGLEMASNYTQMALAGIDDEYDRLSKFERGLQYMTDNFRFVTLMGPEIAAMKQMAAVISQTRSLEAIENIAKGVDNGEGEKARLLKFGIDDNMAGRMWAEINEHGTKQDNIWWANTADWTDKQAAEAYRMALQREVDRIIVTPGQEVPLFMSKPLGSMLMQFRSFATASMQRTLLAGLQQRDSAVLGGALCATGLGMLAYWAKTPSDRISDDPKIWIAEGIDRGGMFGWLDDLNGAVESATSNRLGLRPMLGAKEGRWDNSKAATAVFGPTYGTVFNTVLPLLHDAAAGNVNQYDVHRFRQMLPYNNLFYMKKLFDAAENGVDSTFSVPGKSPLQ